MAKTWSMLLLLLVAVASHIEALCRRAAMVLDPPRSRSYRGRDRRRNPRHCTLCHGPMRPDKRPPRDVRTPDGKFRRVPADVLDWFRCTRCHGSQIGVPAIKLANGWRPAA